MVSIPENTGMCLATHRTGNFFQDGIRKLEHHLIVALPATACHGPGLHLQDGADQTHGLLTLEVEGTGV